MENLKISNSCVAAAVEETTAEENAGLLESFVSCVYVFLRPCEVNGCATVRFHRRVTPFRNEYLFCGLKGLSQR